MRARSTVVQVAAPHALLTVCACRPGLSPPKPPRCLAPVVRSTDESNVFPGASREGASRDPLCRYQRPRNVAAVRRPAAVRHRMAVRAPGVQYCPPLPAGQYLVATADWPRRAAIKQADRRGFERSKGSLKNSDRSRFFCGDGVDNFRGPAVYTALTARRRLRRVDAPAELLTETRWISFRSARKRGAAICSLFI
jgi:hypothetical protein